MESCSRYPDPKCRSLRAALGKHHHLEPEQIICGNGAADLIFQLVWALKPKKALVTAPTFLEYEQALKTVGCQIEYHRLEPEQGFSLDPKAWMEQLDETYDLAFLCNPNNPTGLTIPRESMREMAAYCREKGIRLVADECFNEFLETPEEYSLIPYLPQLPNVLVLKAFTKVYAMAGLRLGYGLSFDAGLLASMEENRQPWSVSGPAQAAGEAALAETDYVSRLCTLISREREFLKAELEDLGFVVYDSQANYLFFRDPDEDGSGQLYEACLKRKTLIRPCGNYPGLDPSYYRICVRTREENQKFCGILREIRRQSR